ncbi:MAG: tRNA uridine-5-carboxymethylaminomethyl(34) synthesis GTPase MnmE [Pseudanabaenaceae cyanobacterium SKYGB_i_bin29]|nr:tRNA uridine-5-carboxymethylaminomethyl(34) synthesis GTPase MnmE [Pseudanabaenaceae cyanobacterium SKYG29]MDW8421212.1 tRNA uridine-5-carboxymethylaminomethyl(34) synthesis GTPase MnmE [Pseudanabaenaceae cyanobacterium SKYGB_i_bin29]
MLGADTIVAIVTALGSVGIVRLSGAQAVAIAQKVFRTKGKWESHRILYGQVVDPQSQTTVDEALVLYMAAPRSYTREDVVEFQCHGGTVIVQQILELCLRQGARLANPGEFTLRAFLNGRIDLAQAESIKDLVGAKSPHAAQLALAGLQGKLSQPLKQLRAKCLDILTEIEARLDFEEDLPPLDAEAIKTQIKGIKQQAALYLATKDRGELIRSGIKVAIVGRPNVGKSSLLNAWSRTDRAIVTDIPGTTRDIVDSQLVVEGIPITVLDTAGIRDTDDLVEQMGMERSRKVAQQADLVLLVIDVSVGWTPEDQKIYELVKEKPIVLIRNKTDLGEKDNIPALDILASVRTAVAQGEGIWELESTILKILNAQQIQAQNLDFAINQRQAECLYRVVESLERVEEAIHQGLPLDFWTIDLRAAIRAVGEITGEEITESLLEQIFSRFCIGK